MVVPADLRPIAHTRLSKLSAITRQAIFGHKVISRVIILSMTKNFERMASKNTSKQETSLQAIILADNFGISALPLGTSWALLPLAGARVIDYTIECFLQTAIDELIIFSVFQFQEVEKYVRERWINPGLVAFRVIFMSSQNCRGMGDALRDIDSKALIKTDFLLTRAGFVSNDDLSSAVAEHRSRRVKDKNAVLTLVYSGSSVNHPERCQGLDTFLILDTVTNRLLHHQGLTNTHRQFDFPVDIVTTNDEVTTRFDLLDCSMAICSAQIPPLFSDNFDFQTRDHLIREILTNEEILAYRVFVHVVAEKYAAFVGDLKTYIAISHSILDRSCFPIVPEALNGDEKLSSRYWCRWPNIYLAGTVKRVAKSAKVHRSVLIGQSCDVMDNCELVNVVMGDNCSIGSNCVLKNCILWNNVVIESDCIVENSILCDKSRLGAKSRIGERCIIGKEVVVPSNTEVPAGSVLCKSQAPPERDVISKPSHLSPGSFCWRIAESSSNDDISADFWPSFARLDLADQSESGMADRLTEDSSDEKSEGDVQEVDPTVASRNLGAMPGSILAEDDYEIFYQEVLESLTRGYSKQISCDNLIMEINSSKHAYNVPVVELQRRVVTAVLATALDQAKTKPETTAELAKAYKSVLSQFLPLITNYIKPKNHSSVSNESTQLNCLNAIKDFALSRQRILPAVSQVLYFLYDKDIFEEEALLSWCKQVPEPLKAQLQSFTQWLEEAEEESSDDD